MQSRQRAPPNIYPFCGVIMSDISEILSREEAGEAVAGEEASF